MKVIIGYKVRDGADVQPLLLKLRSHVATFPGLVACENLVSRQDRSILTMIQTWKNIDDWTAFQESRIARSLFKEAQPLLEGEPRVTLYDQMPTTSWDSSARSS